MEKRLQNNLQYTSKQKDWGKNKKINKRERFKKKSTTMRERKKEVEDKNARERRKM